MTASRNRGVVFITPPPDGFQQFRPELRGVRLWAEDTLRKLPFVGPEGPCSTSCVIDESHPEIINASAGRVGRGQPPKYIIRMYAGLPYWSRCFSAALRVIGPELSWFRGLRLDHRRIPVGMAPQDALATAAFGIMCVFCFHHELAHIYMGHIDFLMANRQRDELLEADNGAGLRLEELRAMEAEADRQAVEWSAGIYSALLGSDSGERNLLFPSDEAAWDFFGLALTLQCVLMQQVCPTSFNSTHPNANQRSFVMFAFIDDYFARVGKPEDLRARIRQTSSASRLEYAARLGLVGGATLEGNAFAHDFMSEVGAILDRMGIGRFRMRVARPGG